MKLLILTIFLNLWLLGSNAQNTQFDTLDYIAQKTFKILTAESCFNTAFYLNKWSGVNCSGDWFTDTRIKESSLNTSDIFPFEICRTKFDFPDSSITVYLIKYIQDTSLVFNTGIKTNNLFLTNSNKQVVFLNNKKIDKLSLCYFYKGKVKSSVSQNDIYLAYKDFGFTKENLKNCLYLMNYTKGAKEVKIILDNQNRIEYQIEFDKGEPKVLIFDKEQEEIINL